MPRSHAPVSAHPTQSTVSLALYCPVHARNRPSPETLAQFVPAQPQPLLTTPYTNNVSQRRCAFGSERCACREGCGDHTADCKRLDAWPSSAAFDLISSALSDDAERKDAVKKGGAIFAFTLKNDQGETKDWFIDLKESGTVGKGNAPDGKKANGTYIRERGLTNMKRTVNQC